MIFMNFYLFYYLSFYLKVVISLIYFGSEVFFSANAYNCWTMSRTNCVPIVGIFEATAATSGGCVGKCRSRRDGGRAEEAMENGCFKWR